MDTSRQIDRLIRPAIRILAAASVAALLTHCAHVEPPSGGPVDTQAPYATEVFPAPGAVRVPPDAVLKLRFSEWIDRSASQGRVLLSPQLPGKLKTEVDGDRLLIHPSEPFQPNTAYRLTVLGSLKDLHGVAMGASFSLRFTTGDGFDSGKVSGNLFAPDKNSGALVALYRMSGRDLNTVLPRSTKERATFHPDSLPAPGMELPAAVAIADSTGSFVLDSISQGGYAMFAFQDINGNFTPDIGFEPIGIGPLNVTLSPGGEEQFLRLVLVDTASVRRIRPEVATSDTAAWSLSFLNPPDGSGRTNVTQGTLLPGAEYRLRSNHVLRGTYRSVLEKRVEARIDTIPVKAEITGVDSLEFSLRLKPPLRAGQVLQLRLRPGNDSGFSDTAFRTLSSAKASDSSKLGGLSFRIPEAYKGWVVLLQSLSAPGEQVVKPLRSDSLEVSPLETGRYRLSAFQDKDGDGLWNPGSLRPWIPQEPYRVLLESIEVNPGSATDGTAGSANFKTP